MSTKTTTMNNNNVSNTSTNSNLTSSPTTTTLAGVKIKKELPSSDEIKEFAENTMNELLGWYGFDGVERLDLSTKTSRLLQTAAVAAAAAAAAGNITNTNNNNNNNNTNNNNTNAVNTHQLAQQQQHQQQQQNKHQPHHPMEKRRNRSSRGGGGGLALQQSQRGTHVRNISSNNNNNNNNNNSNSNNNNNNNNNNDNNTTSSGNVSSLGRKSAPIGCNSFRNSRSSGSGRSLMLCGGGANLCTGNESTNSDHDTRSSRDDDSKSPLLAEKYSVMDEKADNQNCCCWCRRTVPENAPGFLTTLDGPRYCSESCFTQSRRASFKKAKTCDWCKHVRHAVSYVDFQDGASQLQFCSDKCLNQYKMQIFCKETQAHLDMNPHLRHQGIEAAVSGNGAGLITPDLWLRNCRSRSASPASTISVSPGPTTLSLTPPLREPTPNGGQLQHPCGTSTPSTSTVYAPIAHIHKPVISVAPVSKLMSKSPGIMANRQSPKHNRKKRPLRSTMTVSELTAMGAAKHQQQSTVTSTTTRELLGNLNKTKSLSSGGSGGNINNSNNLRTSPGGHLMVGSVNNVKSTTPTLSQFAGSSVQDLHMSVPPLSPMLEQQQQQQLQQQPTTSNFPSQSHVNATCDAPTTSIPPNFFATMQPPIVGHMPPTGLPPPRLPFFPNSNPGLMPPRFMGAPMPSMLSHDMASFGSFLGAPPPVTVMVPYPILLPLPIPIPVPLPIIEFHKAYLSPQDRERLKNLEPKLGIAKPNENQNESLENKDATIMKIDEPLDYTKNKDESDHDHDHVHSASTSAEIVNSLESPETSKSIENRSKSNSTPSLSSRKNGNGNGNEDFEKDNSSSMTNVTHCIVQATENDSHRENEETFCTSNDGDDTQQKLPKFKITRLQAKRTLIQQQTKESECTRPLRKRKRIIDCDFQKIALKEQDEAELQQNIALEGATTASIRTSTTEMDNALAEHEETSLISSESPKTLNSNKK